MFKSRHILRFSFLLLIFCALFRVEAYTQKYQVEYRFAGKDTSERSGLADLKTSFNSRKDAEEYLSKLTETLYIEGYAAASIDSIHADSTRTRVWVFPGQRFQWKLNLDSVPADAMSALNLSAKNIPRQRIQYKQIKALETRLLNYYENTGYPFARVYTESELHEDTILSTLKIDPRVLYHIDSIRIIGTASLKNSFLQHYLGIRHGDIYYKEKLSRVNQLLENLPYIQQGQPWDLMMLGTGATMNLYLHPKRSSEINALVGFLPSSGSVTGKTKITADVRLNLKNALSGGETILLNWQQLEAQSPKLDVGFTQPYIFNTPYGIDFSFGMLKKDSSYLQLNTGIGIQYTWAGNQTLGIFYRTKNNFLLHAGIDTNAIRFSKQLPPFMDVRSSNGGLSYEFNGLDYIFNPRKGLHLNVSAAAGLRKIKRNNDIVNLKDPFDPDFDFASLYDTIQEKTYIVNAQLDLANYFSVARNSVFKLGLKAGWMMSPQLFQNELYRIGGYKIMRGFDEESIYADRYSVLTGEYRLLTGINSFLFGFIDFGLTRTTIFSQTRNNTFASTGLGLELETGFGLLNLSYAIGKRNDVSFDIRNASKIHFGYINYF